MIDVVFLGDLHCLISTAVINHKRFNAVNAVNFLGQILERDGESGLFIQAGNLNNKFHDELGWALFFGDSPVNVDFLGRDRRSKPVYLNIVRIVDSFNWSV